MKKKVYLHIGSNKTGTTAIQLFLDTNELLLNRHGVHYCGIGKIWNAHFPMAWELGCGKAPANYNVEENLWEKAELEFRTREENAFVISSENFILLKDMEKIYYLKKLFNEYDVSIVLFIRRQDLWIESLYLQSIKMGNPVKKFKDYHNNCGQQLDYSKILQPWEEVFGPENIKIVNFDNTNVKSNLIGTFLDIVSSVKIELPIIKNKVANETITRELAEFLIQYNQFLLPQKRLQLINFYNKFIKNKNSLNTKFLNKQARIDFLEKYKESNMSLSIKYFEKSEIFDTSIPDYDAVMEYEEDEINKISQLLIGSILNKIDYLKLM